MRYTRPKFPEDLTFQETPNRDNYQGRYILRHPFEGKATCDAGRQYQSQLPKQKEQQAQTLANLTGWNITEIRKKMGMINAPQTQEEAWWKKIFSDK